MIELEVEDELNLYNIYEFINKKDVVDFEMSSPIYSEKDFMNLGEEEAYVLNNLLDSDRVRNKIKNANGYVGTVEKVNGVYKKISNESYKSKFGKNS